MDRKDHWIHKLTTDLRDEALPGVPVLELAGDRRVLIECHYGVSEYGPEQIGIKVKYGVITVTGSGLRLAQMCRERVVISGTIDAIRLTRRNNNGK